MPQKYIWLKFQMLVFVARIGKSFGPLLPAAVAGLVLVAASDVVAAASHVYFPRASRFGKVFAYQARLQKPSPFPQTTMTT